MHLEEQDAIGAVAENKDIIFMENHGILCIGKDIQEAFKNH